MGVAAFATVTGIRWRAPHTVRIRVMRYRSDESMNAPSSGALGRDVLIHGCLRGNGAASPTGRHLGRSPAPGGPPTSAGRRLHSSLMLPSSNPRAQHRRETQRVSSWSHNTRRAPVTSHSPSAASIRARLETRANASSRRSTAPASVRVEWSMARNRARARVSASTPP